MIIWTDTMVTVEELAFACMCVLISACIAEYIDRYETRAIRSVHNSRLQGHAWLMEMLHTSSSVRCRGLLRMQKQVLFRLCDTLKERVY